MSTVRVGRKVWHIMKGKNCVTVEFVTYLYVLCVTHVLLSLLDIPFLVKELVVILDAFLQLAPSFLW